MCKYLSNRVITLILIIINLTLSGVLIVVAIIEFYLNEKQNVVRTVMFYTCFSVIFLSVWLLSSYVLMEYKYSWLHGMNTFIYCTCELIAGVIILTQFQYFLFRWYIAAVFITLLVTLFLLNLFICRFFTDVKQHLEKEAQKTIEESQVAKQDSTLCVRVPLR